MQNFKGFFVSIGGRFRFVRKRANRKKSPSAREKEARERARSFVRRRLLYFQEIYRTFGHDVSYGRVAIKSQKTRWGSCSRPRHGGPGNLNFNYKIIFLPEHLSDYIIIHELCHLIEFNHSKNFWDKVAKVAPDHKGARKELRAIRLNQLGKKAKA